MMKRFAPYLRLSNQKGLTLLELIVSLTIGLFLLLAMALTYNIGFRVSQQVSDIANLHDNARTVFDRIGRDLASAGYVDLMDKPRVPFKNAETGVACLNYTADQVYASHTLNFEQENITRMYSRAVDSTTDANIARDQLSTIGLISCGNMQPVVGCDGDFALTPRPSAERLFNPSTKALCTRTATSNPFNPSSTTDLQQNSQLQVSYQIESHSDQKYASLRSATAHKNDQTGVNNISTSTVENALDCAGHAINQNQNGFVVNRYALRNSGNDKDQLVCVGNGEQSQPVSIASNIREFKVRYRLGANESNDVELSKSRTSVISVENRIASELNRTISPASNGYINLDEKDMAWSRVVGVEVCLVVYGQPTDGIIPSNLAESQASIPTCTRDSSNRELYAANVARPAGDNNYYLRLTRTFALPNTLFQFEVNR